MKKWWVLFYVLSFCMLEAETPSFPGSMYPGFWGESGSTLEKGSPSNYSSPARLADSLWISLFWNDFNAIEDCNLFGVSAEWGRSFYRSAFLFSLMRMDSIYKAILVNGEISFQKGRVNIGVGHIWQTEWVPGIDTWPFHQTKIGVHFQLFRGFSLGGVYHIINEEENKWRAGIHWSSLSSETCFFLELGVSSLNVGQSIHFGSFFFQSAFSFPGPQISIGLVFHFRALALGIGFYQNSTAFSSQSFHLNWNASDR